jgi:hypothetical protein
MEWQLDKALKWEILGRNIPKGYLEELRKCIAIYV